MPLAQPNFTQPQPTMWPEDPDAWPRMAEALAKDARRTDPPIVFLMPNCCHLSPRGHALSADALEPLVQGILPR